MKKVKTLFVIDRATGLATETINEGSEWVLSGEFPATLKYDGSACWFNDNKLYRRVDRRLSGKWAKIARRMGADFVPEDRMFNVLPEGSIPCEEKPAPHSLHFPHWVLVGDGPDDAYHREALANAKNLINGKTYELVGPKVCGNSYKLESHELWEHGNKKVEINDFSFEGLKSTLEKLDGEGFVWHHPDGRMVKVRKKDFGFEFGLPDPRNKKTIRNKM